MILVVEGPDVDSRTVSDALSDRDVHTVTSVADAREWCLSNQPDVIVLGGDLETAADFVHDIRNGSLLQERTPIVAVSDDTTVDPESLGIDEVLTPPIDTERLQESIQGAMLLDEYKTAVDEFFDRCEEQASDDLDTIFAEDSVREARIRADESLEELKEERGIPFDQLINDA